VLWRSSKGLFTDALAAVAGLGLYHDWQIQLISISRRGLLCSHDKQNGTAHMTSITAELVVFAFELRPHKTVPKDLP
jgi:hypothetical protein